MALGFPSSPTNNQKTVVGGIPYIYSTADGVWSRDYSGLVKSVNSVTPDGSGNVTVSMAVTASGITDSSAVGRTLLTAADAAAQRTALGLGTAATTATTAYATAAQGAKADAALPASQRGAANGVAPLGADSKIPAVYLPSFVDDVLEYANFAALPGTGSTGILYVTIDNGKVFRWSGSAYTEISSSPGSTDAVAEGATNKYYTDARARAAISATGSVSYNSTTGVISFTDAVSSVAGRTGAVTLTKTDVDLANVDNTADSAKPVSTAQQAALDAKQATLVSGTNIKTVGGVSPLGSGNLPVVKFTQSETAPVSPAVGDEWQKDSIGRVFKWDGSFWFQI